MVSYKQLSDSKAGWVESIRSHASSVVSPDLPTFADLEAPCTSWVFRQEPMTRPPLCTRSRNPR
jgi:hypothetical protein